MRRRILPFFLVSVLALGAGCQTDSAPGSEAQPASPDQGSGATSSDPDQPMSWGPIPAELSRAQEMVADWSAARLAGQVIVGRYYGTSPEEAADLVRDLHLAGVSIGGDNIIDGAQVRAT